MKWIIAGGRDKPLFPCIVILDKIVPKNITEVVSGGAKGVDYAGEWWADKEGIPVKIFKANWDKYGKSAGYKRNKEMAEYADGVILLPGGKGTDMMYSLALEYNLEILDYRSHKLKEL